MPRCMITFSKLSGPSSNASAFSIRCKWGRDAHWCQHPHITPSSKLDASGDHAWSESIIIQTNFDWTKDAIVFHVSEMGIFTNTAYGDAQVPFNQLVRNQATPLSLPLTTRLGTVKVAGQLKVTLKALDFGHEVVQMVQPSPAFQPHYFVASTVPLASQPGIAPPTTGVPTTSAAPSAGSATSSQTILPNGQTLYLQPMMSAAGVPLNPASGKSQPSIATMPTNMNGGYVFYAAGAPSSSSQHPSIYPLASAQLAPPPAYGSAYPSAYNPHSPFSLAVDSQYTADFTYDAPPSAPLSTLYPPLDESSSHNLHAVPEPSPARVPASTPNSASVTISPPSTTSYLPNNGESFI